MSRESVLGGLIFYMHLMYFEVRHNSSYINQTLNVKNSKAELFATMRTSVPRINACFRSQRVVYFNLYRELFFILYTHTSNQMGAYFAKRKYLSWKGDPLLFMVANSPSSQVPCLESTALAPLAFPSPPAPTSL